MKVEATPVNNTTMVTKPETQKVIAKQKDSKNVMYLARHTDSKEVQETILSDNKDNVKVLTALAGNPELHADVEVALAKMSEKFPTVARALLSRREEM